MFTGIVEEIGKVKRLQTGKNLARLSVRANKVLKKIKKGDSVAVNGACLTVTGKRKGVLDFDLMKETLEATTLGGLKLKDEVNLERALRADGRISGHFVTGHIDEVARLKDKRKDKNYIELVFALTKDLKPYIVKKGSVCIDGVSLTVGDVKSSQFSVYLIPFTDQVTTLGKLKKGGRVNIETDILAKYLLNNRFSAGRRKTKR